MTTSLIEVLVPGDPATPPDPYRYGWRPVERRREDGTVSVERVPLTLADVLHPQEGDQMPENDAHERRRRYLADVFEARLAGDPTAVVLSNVLIAWDIPGLGGHGPDVAVIQGVRRRRNWGTFDVAAEGARPALIVELTSPGTAGLDRSEKLEEYEQAGVPLYVIVDGVARRQRPTLRLLGYTLTPSGYQPLAPDERGWLWLAPVRLWLGVEGDEIVCYDEDGRPQGDYRALAVAVTAAERARMEAERARAEAERRATAEAAARAEAEDRLRALEAELRRLRGG
jgi:colicin import membrane protein